MRGLGGRPIKPRDNESLQRDVQHISRLRTAMLIDDQLDPTRAKHVIAACDALIDKLQALLRVVPVAKTKR
jgi:hypothetical protein